METVFRRLIIAIAAWNISTFVIDMVRFRPPLPVAALILCLVGLDLAILSGLYRRIWWVAGFGRYWYAYGVLASILGLAGFPHPSKSPITSSINLLAAIVTLVVCFYLYRTTPDPTKPKDLPASQ